MRGRTPHVPFAEQTPRPSAKEFKLLFKQRGGSGGLLRSSGNASVPFPPKRRKGALPSLFGNSRPSAPARRAACAAGRLASNIASLRHEAAWMKIADDLPGRNSAFWRVDGRRLGLRLDHGAVARRLGGNGCSEGCRRIAWTRHGGFGERYGEGENAQCLTQDFHDLSFVDVLATIRGFIRLKDDRTAIP